MALFNLTRFFLLIALLSSTISARPITPQQPVLLDSQCESVDKFTTKWFLTHTKNEPKFRQEITGKALFYTRGMTESAKKLACRRSEEFVTIWDVWPKYLYDETNTPSNRMRCIHQDPKKASRFYGNMSRAYALMARKTATVMHSSADYERPPQDGIWGRIELPALGSATDVEVMAKINGDGSVERPFKVPRKEGFEVGSYAVVEAMAEVRGWLRGGGEGRGGGSCEVWEAGRMTRLDKLFADFRG